MGAWSIAHYPIHNQYTAKVTPVDGLPHFVAEIRPFSIPAEFFKTGADLTKQLIWNIISEHKLQC